MKARVTLVMVALVLSGCDAWSRAPAQSYKSLKDRWIVRLGLSGVGIMPCRKRGSEHQFVPTDECLKMQPARRWWGVWVLGPYAEGEQFCPNSGVPCQWKERPRFELEFNPRVFKNRPQVKGTWGRSYAIEFVGRRTMYTDKGNWGDYTIMVDRLDSMKDVGPAPR